MSITIKIPRAQALLVTLILSLFLLLFLQESYFNYDYPSLRITFKQNGNEGVNIDNGRKSQDVPIPAGKPSAESEVFRESPLPGFCDYCGPEDELCQKYGEANLARGLAYEGPAARLKRVMRKARSGQKIKIGILGGSVTHGHGVQHNQKWTTLYENWWKTTFPNTEIQLINGAVPASETNYFQTCYAEHIDEDVDVVVIEMAINDRRLEELVRSYEFLVRALLELPSKPAVINLHVIALSFAEISMGGDLHTAVSLYYDTPIVSVRNLLLPHLLHHAQSTSLSQDQTLTPDPPIPTLEEYWFAPFLDGSPDLRHMGFRGHLLMSELLSVFSRKVLCNVLREEQAVNRRGKEEADGQMLLAGGYGSGWRQLDDMLPGDDILEYIPRLRLFDKYDAQTIRGPSTVTCNTMTSDKHPLVPIASETSGWTRWAPEQRPDKIYLRATVPGSKIAFKVITGTEGKVRLTYLRSKTFGMGSVWCWVGDDRNKGVRVDGWWEVDGINNGGAATIARGLPPGEHTLRCSLLQETKDTNGGHDFRIIALDSA